MKRRQSLFRQSQHEPAKINTVSLLDTVSQLLNRGQFQDALALLEESGGQKSNDADLMNIAGICAFSVDDLELAEHYWRRAIDIEPNFHNVYSNLGVILEKKQRFGEAETCYRKAVTIKPDFAEAHSNLGDFLEKQKRFYEAEASYQNALSANASLPDVCRNLGNMLFSLKRYDEAESCYRRALSLKPDFADVDWSLGLLLLCRGQFAEGWRRHEARYHPSFSSSKISVPSHLPFPQWQGQTLPGKSIVIWPEQGYGDQIQFCRYIASLKRLGASKITLVCETPLIELFKTLADVDAVISKQEVTKLNKHDYWALILSLPHYCGTSLETVVAELPYFHASRERVRKWLPKLPGKGFRIGLVWKGSSSHKNDQNRSLPNLGVLVPLWGISDVVFISLQKGPGEEEAVNPPVNQPIIALGRDIQAFADTAAIISQLDLVICVDTAIAHLAGALNKPCWVLLSAIGSDWRWLLDRNDTPWYPGVMRLFRQEVDGDWGALVSDVALALEAWCQCNIPQSQNTGKIFKTKRGLSTN